MRLRPPRLCRRRATGEASAFEQYVTVVLEGMACFSGVS